MMMMIGLHLIGPQDEYCTVSTKGGGFISYRKCLLDDKKGASGSRYHLGLGGDMPTCACKSGLHFF